MSKKYLDTVGLGKLVANILSKFATKNHSHSNATTNSAGFMSSSDKVKLDGVAAGANKTIVDSSLNDTSTNPIQNKAVKTALDGKAASSHTHPTAQITGLDSALAGKASASHKHDAGDITSGVLAISSGGTGASTVAGAINRLFPTDESANIPQDTFVPVFGEGFADSGYTNMGSLGTTLWPHIKGNADAVYQPKGSYASSSHTHDDRYYTETEINSKLDTKADIGHTHTVDSSLSSTSTNPVQNKVVNSALAGKVPTTRTINGKALSVNIALTAADVGADASGAANSALTSAKSYTDGKIANILDNSTEAIDSITELAEAMKTNKDAIDSLTNIAASKANASDFNAHKSDTTSHITATERSNWNAAKTHAGTAHAPSNAQANQNAFSNVTVGSTVISADTQTDNLTLAGSNVTLTPDATNDKITIGITKANVTNALGYTPPTTNTTYGVGTASSLGLTRLYTSTGTAVDGTMTQNAITSALGGKANSSHTHTTSQVSGLDAALSGKAPTSHTHTIAQVTNLQSQLDSKQPKGSYAAASHSHAWSAITGKPSTFAPSSHNHTSLAYGSAVDGTTDWNTIPAGVHSVASSSFDASKHAPVGAYPYGTVMVESNGSNINQIYVAHQDGDMWFRNRFSSSNEFSNWQKVATSSHTHTIAQVTNLQSSLDSKQPKGSYAAASHNHNAGNITSGTLPIARGGTGTTSANGIRGAIGINPVTTGGTGAAYTATVNGITSLIAGAEFMMVPHTVSTTTSPTLNVNGLGAKSIRRRVSNSTVTTVAASSANWLGAGKPIKVVYDGLFWIADFDRPNAADIYGTISSGQIADGSINLAKLASDIGTVAVGASQPTDSNVKIWIQTS